MSGKNSKNPNPAPGRFLKAGLAVLFVLVVAFFTVKVMVHPQKSPYADAPEFRVPLFSKPVVKPKPKPGIVIAPRPDTPPPAAAGPHVAIILDDWGKNHKLLKNVVDIGRPVTIAVIPHLSKSRQIAEDAHRQGLEVMLHLPMEPKGKNQPTEPSTIRTSMTDAEILKLVDDALAAVPHLSGVNNHQGSAATSDERVMKTILKRLKAKKLFFVDSHVVASTKAPRAAMAAGIPFASRDVFIDNVNQLSAIKAQLEKAKNLAVARGEAVVIGHDRKLTVQAIREMVPAFDAAGVRLVFAGDVVRIPAADSKKGG